MFNLQDSAVQDWLASCEARFQALVVKLANEKDENEVESNFGDACEESGQEDGDGDNDQRRSVLTPPVQKVEPPNEVSGETAAGAKKLNISKIATPVGVDASVEEGAMAAGCVELEPEKENVELSPQSMGNSISDPVVESFARRRVTGSPMSQAKPSPGNRHHSTALVDSALVSPRENRREKVPLLGKPVTPLATMQRERRFMSGVTLASGKAIGKLEEKRSPLGSTTGSPSSRSPGKSVVGTVVTHSEALSGQSGAKEGIFRFAENLPDTCDVIETPLRPSPPTSTNCLIRTPPKLNEDLAWAKAGQTLAVSFSNVQRADPLVGDGACNGGVDREQLRPASEGVMPFAGGQDREGAGDVEKNRCQLDASIGEPTIKSPPTVSCSRDAIDDEDVGIASPTCSTRAVKAKYEMTPDENSYNEEVRHDSQRDEENLSDPGRKKESPVGPACAADALDDNSDGGGCATECEDSPGEGSDHESLPLFFVADEKVHAAPGKSKGVSSSRSQGVPSEGVGRGEAMGGKDGGLFAGESEHEEDWDEEDDGEETCDEGGMEEDLDAGSPSRRPTEATVAENAALGNGPPDALGDGDWGVGLPLGNGSENVDASKGPKQPPLCQQAGRQKKCGLDSRETTSSVTPQIMVTEHGDREMEVSGCASQGVESSHTPLTGETTGSVPTCQMRLASETEISNSRDQALELTKHPGPPAFRELCVEESEPHQLGRSWTKLPRSPMRRTPDVKPQKNEFKDELKVRNAPLNIGDALDEVCNTPSPRQAIEQVGTDSCDASNDATVCLTKQKHSEQDGTAGTVVKQNSQGTDDQDAPHIPETEMADQSFGTQEVPETELAGVQSALGDDSPLGASVEWPAPTLAAPVKGSTLSESEIPETPQVQDSMLLSAPEMDSSRDPDKITSHATARSASCKAAESLSGRSSVTLSGETADIRAHSEWKATHEGFAGSPGAWSEDNGSEYIPRVVGLRRSVGSVLSASDVSVHAESPEKRCKSTPPPVERSSVDDSAGGDADRSSFSGGGCDASRRESEEVGHDLAAAQDAWQAAGNTGAGDGYYEYATFSQNTSNEGERTGRPRSIEDGSSTQRRQIREVSNPYAPDSCLELKHDDDPSSNATEAPCPDGGRASRANPATDGKTSSRRSSRHPLSRPSSAIMSFGAPSRANTLVGPAVLGSANARAQIRERDRHRSSNKILGAGWRGLPDKQESVAMTGSWLSYDMGPDTSVRRNFSRLKGCAEFREGRFFICDLALHARRVLTLSARLNLHDSLQVGNKKIATLFDWND